MKNLFYKLNTIYITLKKVTEIKRLKFSKYKLWHENIFINLELITYIFKLESEFHRIFATKNLDTIFIMKISNYIISYI